MPQCPKCQNPYEVGQRYCEKCDSYLLNPEEGDHFCPQCGIRVASEQEVCHKCNATLPGRSGPPSSPPEGTPPRAPEPLPPPLRIQPFTPSAGLPGWALGALIGAGVVIVALLLIILFKSSPGPPPVAVTPPPKAAPEKAPPAAPLPKAETPPETPSAPAAPLAKEPAVPATPPPATPITQPAAPAPTAPAPEASLADQVKETLNALRDAQLKQDLIIFMSCYSYIYPTLDQKRRDTQMYWNGFSFLGLDYFLDEVKPAGPDTALAKVTWTMQVQSRRSQLIDTFTQKFEVGLAKELGKWRIRSIKDVTEEEE